MAAKKDRFGGHMKCTKEHHVGSISVGAQQADGRYIVDCDYVRTDWSEGQRWIGDRIPMTVDRIFDLTGRKPAPKEPGHG